MKAVVLEVRGREAAILAKDGSVRVVRGRYEVGQCIDYVEPFRPSALQWVAAILVAAMLIGGSAGLWINANYVAYAEVSLDVSPSSIVYTVNRRNRVLSVRAVNDEAAGIVDALGGDQIRFKPIGEAVEQTMAVMAREGYMGGDDGDYALASVSADDEGRRDDLTRQVDAAMSHVREADPALEYRVDSTDRATARAARDNGMSPGRYNAWKAGGGEGQPQTYAEMPVRDILAHNPPPDAAAPAPAEPKDAVASPAEPKAGEEREAASAALPKGEEREAATPTEPKASEEREAAPPAEPQAGQEREAAPPAEPQANEERKSEPVAANAAESKGGEERNPQPEAAGRSEPRGAEGGRSENGDRPSEPRGGGPGGDSGGPGGRP